MAIDAIDPKVKCDALLELWKGTGSRIRERRTYEWKTGFAIWGALLLTLGELIVHSTSFRPNALHHLSHDFLVSGIVLTALHGVYVFGFVWFRNQKDADRAIDYEREINRTLGIGQMSGTMGQERWWRSTAPLACPVFELGMTFLLAVVIGPLAIRSVG